jgi:hypothetical protein
VEPGSAAEIASALVRSFEQRIVRIVTGHADALAGPTASGSAGRGEAGRPQDCAW